MNKFQLAGFAWLYAGLFFLVWAILYGALPANPTVTVCGFMFWLASTCIAIYLYRYGESYAKHS